MNKRQQAELASLTAVIPKVPRNATKKVMDNRACAQLEGFAIRRLFRANLEKLVPGMMACIAQKGGRRLPKEFKWEIIGGSSTRPRMCVVYTGNADADKQLTIPEVSAPVSRSDQLRARAAEKTVSESKNGIPAAGSVGLLDGVEVQRNCDPTYPGDDSVEVSNQQFISEAVARGLAPTDIKSIENQSDGLAKLVGATLSEVAITRCFFLTHGEVSKKRLKHTMKCLEDVANLTIQLRNSLATHCHE